MKTFFEEEERDGEGLRGYVFNKKYTSLLNESWDRI